MLLAAIDSILEQFAIWDADDRLLLANEKFREVYTKLLPVTTMQGTKFEDFIRASFAEHVSEVAGVVGGRAHIEEMIQMRLANHGTSASPFEVAVKDGRVIQVNEQKMADGSVIVLGTDISNIVKANIELKKSQHRMAIAQQIGQFGSWERDLSTNERYWSASLYTIFGLEPEEIPMTQERLIELVHPDDRKLVARISVDNSRDLSQDALEFRIVRPDGTIRQVQSIGEVALDDFGQPARVNGTVHDITEFKAIEAQLHQVQRLEVIGQLTGGIAHDFNNLLAIIKGNLQLLELRDVLDEDDKEFLFESLAATDRGADLTYQLLAFARKQPLRPDATDAKVIIEGMKEMLQRTLSEAIEQRFELNGQGSIMVDPQQLENAILNLAINARDAMPDGGRLTFTIEDRLIETDGVDAGGIVEAANYCVITVRDTGVGMDENALEHAFEPFFTSKEFGKGSGLGLSMVHGFAGQSHGYATIDSTVDEGTAVSIYLPLITHDDQAAISSEIEPKTLYGDGQLILILEDETALRKTTAKMLQRLNYKILQAADWTEASAILESDIKIDLLFSDVVLPGNLSGPELRNHLRDNYPLQKVLYCSGYVDQVSTFGADREFQEKLLYKPYSVEVLATEIHAALREA